MAVSPENIINVEIIQDGGSLVASFQGTDSCEYQLGLMVKGSFTEPQLINKTLNLRIKVSFSDVLTYIELLQEIATSQKQIEMLDLMQHISLNYS